MPQFAQSVKLRLIFQLTCVKLMVIAQKPRLCGKLSIAYKDNIYQWLPAPTGRGNQAASFGSSFEMNDLMLSSLKSYWERLRAGRIAPYRAEIDPRQFESALENMFILERVGIGNMRIRLAGMKVCEMMGMEVRGMQPGYLIEEADRQRFDRLLNVVMGEPAVVELKLEAKCRGSIYRATMLLMPLRSDFGDINRVLGCTSGEGEAYAPPLSFSIRDVSVTPIEQHMGADPAQALPGFAEQQQAFTGAPAGPPRLRAIEGNPDAPSGPRQGGPKLRIIDGS